MRGAGQCQRTVELTQPIPGRPARRAPQRGPRFAKRRRCSAPSVGSERWLWVLLPLLLPFTLGIPGRLSAQPSPAPTASTQQSASTPPPPHPTAWLVVDNDDDDEDGQRDSQQAQQIPQEDLLNLAPWLGPDPGAVQVEVTGSGRIRLVQNGRPVPSHTQPDPSQPLYLQGLRSGSAKLRIRGTKQVTTLRLQVARLVFLDGHNRPLDPAQEDAPFSLEISNSSSLPNRSSHRGVSRDRRNLRLELSAPATSGSQVSMTLNAGPAAAHPSTLTPRLQLELRRPDPNSTFRSNFVRLVADEMDLAAPGVRGQLLRVALLDRLRAQWSAPNGQQLSQDITVGIRTPTQPYHAYRASVRVTILRTQEGGPAVIGRDNAHAMAIMRGQLLSANQVWAQCGVTFGPPAAIPSEIQAPPPPSLLSIADGNGLPAKGDGQIALSVDGQPVGPIRTLPSATPLATAQQLAEQLRIAGFQPQLSQNARSEFGALPSADLLVYNSNGALAHLAALGAGQPIGDDSRQHVQIGHVQLADGLTEFNNLTADSGTLEERALVKALSAGDPGTIEIFVVNHFSRQSRQGEAFIGQANPPMRNVVILDRAGLIHRDRAWTLAHELGHILLAEALHPDNWGPDEPYRLMDADSNRGTVYGPKRLTLGECQRAWARHHSAAGDGLLQGISQDGVELRAPRSGSPSGAPLKDP